ncbi:RdgB/HAM1 family non-canonical purine NTP pyrophosphatase [Candidatus Micrarchaeota archaeon]|nr:RdgB/HAM1 family non-canonical purine NTP pyrophosphatase [Candidatus Micrarchaeota archaeon]
MKLTFITGNQHKFREAERILKEYNVIIGRKDINCEEIRSESCEEVALTCLRLLRRKVNKPFFVEDSGLFIKALDGFPGTLSSWVFKKIGNEGILKLLREEQIRDAYFLSAIAVWDGRKEKVLIGRVDGYISRELRGKGFGYDPIFIPAGSEKTFGEDEKIKSLCSHRRNSLKKLAEWIGR